MPAAAFTTAVESMREFYWKFRARMTDGGSMAARLDRARSLLFAGSGDWTLRSGNAVELFRSGCRRQSRRLGQVSSFRCGLLFAIVAFRALRRKVLWRLRNRLIVTYVFIGVIPAALLVTMALVTDLPFCRAVCQLRSHFGNQLTVAQHAGSKRSGQ